MPEELPMQNIEELLVQDILNWIIGISFYTGIECDIYYGISL